MESKYLQQRERDGIERFDNETKYREFSKRHKAEIENGLTLTEFKNRYYTTDEDIAMFEKLREEVGTEKANGDAFLKGFQSVSNNAYGIKGV